MLGSIKKTIKRNKVLRVLTYRLYFKVFSKMSSFSNSGTYWKKRYQSGKSSGDGSYGKLAEFKTNTINEFLKHHNVISVVELGCGDGNQLKNSLYPEYTGFDISEDAVSLCKKKFGNQKTMSFYNLAAWNDSAKFDLGLSLDVIYHLTEDDVYLDYLEKLFGSSEKYVIIYSSNTDKQYKYQLPHIKHRNFLSLVSQKFAEWKLIDFIENPYPYNGNDEETSFADFYIFQKVTVISPLN